jgi:alpha-tubulin suppressor-like RCC1 family protein
VCSLLIIKTNILESGKVYITGENGKSNLGLGHSNKVNAPELVEYLSKKKIRKIACNISTTALTYEGDLYVWGNNGSTIVTKPEKSRNISQPIRDIKAGFDSQVAIDIDNNCWAWSQSVSN